ncbi:hypothetical protein EST38_g11788 [Candolleomyces aberdarensis]|uniref:Uncharacterized protein n=1 Tax=Candolleomyces aberdarensis TaxID=2316362 RepID=A0A4V1Q271_9AGAR|nr:hypothetical protein EST38_g11788 [Candolleomyces aberdarensis]
MVLKRKRGDEWVAAGSESSSTQAGPSLTWVPVPDVLPPAATLAKPRKKGKRDLTGTIVGGAGPTASMAASSSSSAMPVPGPSQPQASPKKRGGGRKKKDLDAAPAPEKRAARFKAACPQNIMDRLERVRTQTFFMVDRRRNDGELREEFSVLGSTGNVYTITIGTTPKCNCPDAGKGNHCKHIVPQSSNLWYQKYEPSSLQTISLLISITSFTRALLTSELETIFANAPAAPNAVTNRRVQEVYARATGKASEPASATPDSKKIPEEEDDCPICYETMYQAKEDKLVWCEECGNALHKECFAQWRATSSRAGKELTCVYCRSKWVVAGASSAGGAAMKAGGYLNLASAAGLSPVRDTSTCE